MCENKGILRTTRSEYGKEIRKDYEAGKIELSRHEFQEYEIREDGIANTIDSVPKDNLLAVSFANGEVQKEIDTAHCLCGDYATKEGLHFHQQVTKVVCPVLTPDREEKRQNGRRLKDDKEPSFTLTAQDRHGVAIEVKEATKQGYAIAHEGDSINLTMPDSKTRRGRIGGGVAQTLDTSCNQGVIETIPGTIPSEHPGQYVEIYDGVIVYAVWYEKYQCYVAIRKLTPRECFRLQGWDDEYFERAEFVNSDSQLYKQAGNGVTVSVVQAIAEALNEQ